MDFYKHDYYDYYYVQTNVNLLFEFYWYNTIPIIYYNIQFFFFFRNLVINRQIQIIMIDTFTRCSK